MPTDLLDTIVKTLNIELETINIMTIIQFALDIIMLFINAGVVIRIIEAFIQMQQAEDDPAPLKLRIKRLLTFTIMINVLYYGVYKALLSYYFGISLGFL